MKKFKLYFWYFICFAIIGWIYEVLYHFLRNGKFMNSGTMIGPWLPIYGFCGLLIYFLSLKFRNKPYKMFILSFFLSGIIEYATSVYLEKVYGMRWWDYSEYAFNINGRTCLAALMVFSAIALIVMYLVLPLLNKIYDKANPRLMVTILAILFVIFTTDFIYSTINPNRKAGIPVEISQPVRNT